MTFAPAHSLTRDEKNRNLSFVGAKLCGFVEALLQTEAIPDFHRESARELLNEFWSINEAAQ